MSPNTHELGTFITTTRRAAGLTMPELAEKVGVSKGLVFAWEAGEKTPTPPNLQKLAVALDLDFEDLFALAGFATPAGLPALPIYLRRKLDVSEDEAVKVERYIARLKKQRGGGDAERDR
jgi:transcriptional regulator with XRE-family HTH domain